MYDFNAPDGGQFNAANAVRSAGSTIKPFLYAEAVEGGLITADTRILDAPLRYGAYSPGNFDNSFRPQGELGDSQEGGDRLQQPGRASQKEHGRLRTEAGCPGGRQGTGQLGTHASPLQGWIHLSQIMPL